MLLDAIPSTRRVTVNDAQHMPHDYSITPGGTLFSTTPGGTRIIYDRKFLLECRGSPVAKTPPRGLPSIPGVTSPSSKDHKDRIHIFNEYLYIIYILHKYPMSKLRKTENNTKYFADSGK
uniref:Uncharacterized protein n=1 Tax=Mastacembelus armatus TaxID=205130 RepID=A0A3Q3SHV0_9TELE